MKFRQKWSSCSWLLLQELAKEARSDEDPKVTWFREIHTIDIDFYTNRASIGAREVMTRPDFLGDLDHLNIIQVDTHYKSVAMACLAILTDIFAGHKRAS